MPADVEAEVAEAQRAREAAHLALSFQYRHFAAKASRFQGEGQARKSTAQDDEVMRII
jgi:hypothetical protein